MHQSHLCHLSIRASTLPPPLPKGSRPSIDSLQSYSRRFSYFLHEMSVQGGQLMRRLDQLKRPTIFHSGVSLPRDTGFKAQTLLPHTYTSSFLVHLSSDLELNPLESGFHECGLHGDCGEPSSERLDSLRADRLGGTSDQSFPRDIVNPRRRNQQRPVRVDTLRYKRRAWLFEAIELKLLAVSEFRL